MTKTIGIRISPADNVVTVVEETAAGDEIQYMTPDGPRQIDAADAVPMGHKVALREIAPGQEVLKYAQPIGTASRRIEAGGHVHDHNVRSAVQGTTDED